MVYIEADDGLLLDHWFFKFEETDVDVTRLPENFLCDECGQSVARHAYIGPWNISGQPPMIEVMDEEGEADDC